MGDPLTEQQFRLHADHALETLERRLAPLADNEGFEVELQGGVLNVVFEPPAAARFVISPNEPVRQVWVSARGHGYKLAWNAEAGAFVLKGESLEQFVEKLVRQQLG
jgi:frataxin